MSAACACGTCASCGGAGGVAERPVADPLRFRHGAIRQRMLDSIAGAQVGNGLRPLAALGVRTTDDPAIALLDAHAASLHVLAWNCARLADDATIGRTEDRDALVDLVRLIGYEPRPALSASTTLAFTLETLPGAPETVRVPKGTKVASVPGQDEKPQIFETSLELDARGAWNAIPAISPLPAIDGSTRRVCVAGVTSAAKPGDLIAVPFTPASGTHWVIGHIARIDRVMDAEDPAKNHLCFALTACRTIDTLTGLATDRAGKVAILARRAAPFGATAPDVRGIDKTVRHRLGVNNATARKEWAGFEVGAPGADDGNTIDLDAAYPEAFADRLVLLARSAKNVPAGKQGSLKRKELRHETVAPRKRSGVPDKTMAHDNRGESISAIEHDGQIGHSNTGHGHAEMVTAQPETPTLTRITAAVERARTDFLLSAKTSRITLEDIDLSADTAAVNATSASLRYLVRELAIFLETETLDLLREPLDVALPDLSDRLVVAGTIAMPPGRQVILAGEQWTSAGVTGAQQAEPAIIKEAQPGADGTTLLLFEKTITRRFRSTRLRVLGNAVGATHGETPASGEEIIGSGKAGARDQRFALKGTPLSHIPAETTRGYAPALELRVGGRAYQETPNLLGLDASDRAYTVRMGREAQAVIQVAGQLPSGLNNVTALYRTGGGDAGNLDAGLITMAMSPVLGVRGIANPVRADGGSEAETIDDMRRAAPLSVRTLDKVVSLADYEAFAAAYRGVGKALATSLYAGMRQVVCLTLADTQMLSPAEGSDIVVRLAKELARVAVPGRAVRIEGFVPLHPQITLALAIDPAFRRKDVEAAIRLRLGDWFGAATRPFARALHRSEVLAAAQAVEGVRAAGLTTFQLPGGNDVESEGRLLCPGPFIDPATRTFNPARLLSIDPDQVLFAEMQP